MSEGYADSTVWCSQHDVDTSGAWCLRCGAAIKVFTFSAGTGSGLVIVYGKDHT